MADAEIIPIAGATPSEPPEALPTAGAPAADEAAPLGTRGRPGRGAGGGRPSSSSRSLAPRKSSSSAPRPPRRRRVEADEGGAAGAESSVSTAPTAEEQEPAPAPVVEPLPDRAERSLHPNAPTEGIPLVDWLSGFSAAAKEIFGAEWEPRLAQFLAFLRRRLTGDYVVDEFGFDAEITERFFYAAIRPVAQKWFRVEVRGAENVPAEGGALVVSNHSGTVPVDGLVTMVSLFDHTGRHLRPLGADLVFRLPVISEMARKAGTTLACHDDAERMLRNGELVGVWPEGFKGIGKPFSERYKLQRFGRGGFVGSALRTGVPIVPTSVVGAEEIYPLVANVPSLARLLGVPYIPVTPLFPLFGPLGLVPLPSKWLIEFGEPIRTDSYDSQAADDPMLVFNVADQVRETIQQTLYTLLDQRTSVFGR